MPFREEMKKGFKRLKDDVKAALERKDGSDKATTRPNTPSSTAPHTNAPAIVRQVDSPNTNAPESPPLAQAPTSPSILSPPGKAETNLDQLSQSTNPIEGHRPDRATDIPPSHIQSDNSRSVGQPASGPQEHLGQTSTGKGLKILATGIAQSATGASKFGPLQSISDMLQGFAEMYIFEGTVKKEHEALRLRLLALLEVLDKHSGVEPSPTMASKIQETREFIERELSSIETKPSGEQHGLLLTAKEKEDRFLDCCRRIQEYMERLSLDTSLLTSASINKMREEQRQNHISSRVSRLPFSSSACYNSRVGEELKRRGCTSGTRVEVLVNLLSWVDSASNNGGVYWLNGMAGTGKTTIAYSVCEELDAGLKLAASFFCSRLREECRDVNVIIPSIAYQLALSSSSFQSALSKVLEREPEVHTKRLSLQFKSLIEEPLLVAQPSFPRALVVVIDALDECDNKESTRDMLDVLLSKAGDLPIKFIVSSRPEPQIRDQMTNERVRSRLVLHELETGNVQADIETYLRDELKPMKPSPGEAQIAALVKRAGILFIYAATAVRYIGYDNFQSDPEDRLCVILGGPQSQEDGQHEEIDNLYTTILEGSLDDRRRRQAERDNMRQILYTVICAREPLTLAGLSGLLRINSVNKVQAALRPLWSVLHVTGAGEQAVVTTLHASFPDFIFSSARSKAYHCNSGAHNQQLAERCLGHIAQTPAQFNICGLESSYILDENVPNIRKRVASAISSELLYASRYWADHVEAGHRASALVESLRDFLSTRLLLWMEVMNLSRQMNAGIECMKMMVVWCNQFGAHHELVELTHDAKRFVEAFASNPVSQSTAHIYVSMLTFWSRSAPIAKHYAQYTHGPVKAEGAALNRRQLAHLATWAFDEEIGAMAVSPDGLCVALGLGNDVLVVYSSSGRVVVGPLKGHKKQVISIAFSPDGTRVLAGSTHSDPYYATILGWDTRTGHEILGPLRLERHTGLIMCLSFSPDCARIATGALDKTVCLWDAETGNILHCLLTTDGVYQSVFSPDGTRIAASTSGGALQVWDSQTGDTTLGPVREVDPLTKITFSHDQSRIICASSGPNGKALYVRDARSGDMILGPIEGHTDRIACIACSPDGRYIVSGSWDRTVCLWDAQHGNMVLGPLEAHTSTITSITFSPDSSCIISACRSGLVCTCDARQQNFPSRSSNAPFGRITCVKFSSDGAQFVSGSEIGTICIWDTHTGEMKSGPIKAHTGRINAVDFLNDRVVSGSKDGNICICDAPSGEVVFGPLEVHPGGTIWAIAFSPNGKHIATGSKDKIDLWDAQTGSRVLDPLTGIKGSVESIQFRPDGTHIVGGSHQLKTGEMMIWEVPDGQALSGAFRGFTSRVYSVSYSPDGALIASGHSDRTIIIWDAYTRKKALGPLTGHSNWVRSVDFSPDSTRLVSGSDDRTIRIWDVQTGETLFEILNGHEDWITSVAYSPDGDRILSYSYDMSVHIHDARSPNERALPGSESEVGEWTINKDGWVVDDQSRLLVWVPGDLRKALGRPRTLVIVPHGNVHLKFDKSRLGESWAQSYASRL